MKKAHLHETQPSLSEDKSLNDEEQISHKPLVLLPTRGQVLWFRSRASTPSPAEPYNFQAGHPSGQAKTAQLPAPQGPHRDGMGECGMGWEGTAALCVAVDHRASQHFVFCRAPFSPHPSHPSAKSITLPGLTVPQLGTGAGTCMFCYFQAVSA